jgi:hypothetical protein
LSYGQDVRRAQPVAPRTELVQNAPDSHEAEIQQLMKRHNISHTAAMQAFQDEQRQRDAQAQQRVVQQDLNKALEQLKHQFANVSREDILQWMMEKNSISHKEAEQQLFDKPDSWLAAYNAAHGPTFETVILWLMKGGELSYATAANKFSTNPDKWTDHFLGDYGISPPRFVPPPRIAAADEPVVYWMSTYVRIPNERERFAIDPESWRQKYQQHLQQVEMEQEQERKATAQAQAQDEARRAALVQATKEAQAAGKMPTDTQVRELVRQAIADRNGSIGFVFDRRKTCDKRMTKRLQQPASTSAFRCGSTLP